MIYNYPFFRFPYFKKYHTNYYNTVSSNINNYRYSDYISSRNPSSNKSTTINNITSNEQEKKASTRNYPSGFSFLYNFLHQEDRNEDEWCLDFLGIKLYYDDILLISLIYFLYKEEVKDHYLFVSLILLLLS